MENLLIKFKSGLKIKNILSNLYLHLVEINSSEKEALFKLGTDIFPKNTVWKLTDAGNDYVYISSNIKDGTSLYLTCTENNLVEPKVFSGGDNQKFYIHNRQKGIFIIKAKIAKNKFGIELKDNKIGFDDKVKVGPINGSKEQNWIFEEVEKEKKSNKLKSGSNDLKVVKTVIYKDEELIHTVVYVE